MIQYAVPSDFKLEEVTILKYDSIGQRVFYFVVFARCLSIQCSPLNSCAVNSKILLIYTGDHGSC